MDKDSSLEACKEGWGILREGGKEREASSQGRVGGIDGWMKDAELYRLLVIGNRN